MRAAAHVEAMTAIFAGTAHPLTASTVTSAKIGITPSILQDYNRLLGKNPLFQAWFSAAQIANRLVLRNPSESPKIISDLKDAELNYATAGYFSGGNLFVSAETGKSLEIEKLSQIGILISDIGSPTGTHISGDNPIVTIGLANGGDMDFSVLLRFIRAEDSVVIYDKYINEAGVQLLEYIAQEMPQTGTLKIFTTHLGKNCLHTNDISTRLSAVKKRLTVECHEVSQAFHRLAHDRYIFCGNRLQIVFTAGIDCFGAKNSGGKRNNKQSKISVYALDTENILSIQAKDGSVHPVNHLTPDTY